MVKVKEKASYEINSSRLSINSETSFESDLNVNNADLNVTSRRARKKFGPKENKEETIQLTNTPKLVATTYCCRRAGYYIFNAFFLIFLITSVSLTIFSIDCKLTPNRLQITYTLLLTSVSFKWVVNRSLPTVSYLTSLDQYAIACIFYICLLCFYHSIIGSNSFPDKEYARLIDMWVLITFAVMFFLFHLIIFVKFYLAFNEIKKLKRKEATFLKRVYEQYNQKSMQIF